MNFCEKSVEESQLREFMGLVGELLTHIGALARAGRREAVKKVKPS
jgi:hypothetical protein